MVKIKAGYGEIEEDIRRIKAIPEVVDAQSSSG